MAGAPGAKCSPPGHPRRREGGMIGRGARRAVLSATVVVAVVATLGVVPAGATATCGFASGMVSVALPADGDSARLTVGTGTDAGRILFGVGDATATPCGTATTATTDARERDRGRRNAVAPDQPLGRPVRSRAHGRGGRLLGDRVRRRSRRGDRGRADDRRRRRGRPDRPRHRRREPQRGGVDGRRRRDHRRGRAVRPRGQRRQRRPLGGRRRGNRGPPSSPGGSPCVVGTTTTP